MCEEKTETAIKETAAEWDADLFGADLFVGETEEEEDLFGNLVRPSFELDEEKDLFGGEEI